MTPIHVVGIGMDGLAGLSPSLQALVHQASVLIGSDRHLGYVTNHPGAKIRLGNLAEASAHIQRWLTQVQDSDPDAYLVVLTSGDPLFFGLGRLLLTEISASDITFHPCPSSIQLAFSRIKVPWHDAELVSAHGRSPDLLLNAIQRQVDKIAVLTDSVNTPQAIARMVRAADLAQRYRIWVCEDLGADTEHVREFSPDQLAQMTAPSFSPLNVVILLRQADSTAVDLAALPKFGIADSMFDSFSDRPNLITKRDVRVLALAELALQDGQTVWDLGAGTGSVAVEIARLCPASQVYAVEKTAAGVTLIHQNTTKFKLQNLTAIHGTAPDGLDALPDPDRIFIGGSGGQLEKILDYGQIRLQPAGIIVLAIATLEHLSRTTAWLDRHSDHWQAQFLQVQLARSVPVASLTRFAPINPVTLVRISPLSP